MLHKDSHNLLCKSGIILFLLFAIFAVYLQVGNHKFIQYDDQIYIIENSHVRSGFTMANIQWAFTAFYAANWHPISWISHMLDVQLFGMNPAGHHLVNVLLHAANSILLFLLLNRISGALWRSAVVAALFALHPLHIESVAWVSERKDLLCALFGILTLYLYVHYVERPGALRYGALLISFIMGLMSKPMIVTLPFIMLLMDYWPLQRLEAGRKDNSPNKQSIKNLFIEKVPLIMLVIGSSAVTYYAQRRGNAVTELAISPLAERASNAIISYTIYLDKTIWPHNLSIFYPFATNIPIWQTTFAFLLLTLITVFVFIERRNYPYLIFGWLWYLTTLVPVIGIVRVGLQSMADRYTYIPIIGIFIMTVWGVSDIVSKANFRFNVLPYLITVIIAACGLTTWYQLRYWRTTKALFTHAVETTQNNYMAFYILGGELEKEGRFDEALQFYSKSVEIAPWLEYAKISRDNMLFHQGRLDAAAMKYNEEVLKNSNSVSGYISLGVIMSLQNRLEEAENTFNKALELYPQSEQAHYNLALTMSRMGRLDEAIYHYQKALEITPNDLNTLNNMGVTLANQGKVEEAIKTFIAALQIKPDFFDARNNMELARKKQNSLPTHPH